MCHDAGPAPAARFTGLRVPSAGQRRADRRPCQPIARAIGFLIVLGAMAAPVLYSRSTARGAVATPAPATFAADILGSMNGERAEADVLPLVEAAEISMVATARALDMASAGYFAHHNAAGIGAEALLREQQVPFRLLGENIARSDYPPNEVVGVVHRALMASPPHRANVLDARFQRVGIAVAVAGDMYYFVVIFAD